MRIERTFRDAFSVFQEKVKPYYWAAQSKDGTVVVTMWLDELQAEGDGLIYGLHPRTALPDPSGKPKRAVADRIKKLQHACNHCKGRLRGIIIDRTTDPKRKHFLVDEALWMNAQWVESTGKFCLRSDPLSRPILGNPTHPSTRLA